MLGHIGINVPDLETARVYYDKLMPLVEFEAFISADDEFAYRPANGKRGTFIFFYPAAEEGETSRHHPGLQHLAFMVPNRAAVTEVFDAAVAMGSEALLPPQEFPQYPPPYHAAFWLDPFGMMIEAVCHHDR